MAQNIDLLTGQKNAAAEPQQAFHIGSDGMVENPNQVIAPPPPPDNGEAFFFSFAPTGQQQMTPVKLAGGEMTQIGQAMEVGRAPRNEAFTPHQAKTATAIASAPAAPSMPPPTMDDLLGKPAAWRYDKTAQEAPAAPLAPIPPPQDAAPPPAAIPAPPQAAAPQPPPIQVPPPPPAQPAEVLQPKPPAVVEITGPNAKGVLSEGFKRLSKTLKAMGVKPAVGPASNFDLDDPSLHPVVLDMIFFACFGPEWREWEQETLDHALGEIAAMGGGEISEQNREKLQVMQVLYTTTNPWVSMQPFAKTAQALDSRIPDFEVLEPVSPETILCALQVMRLARPGDAFSHEILRYIATCCVNAGVLVFPDPVLCDKVNEAISRIVNRSVPREDLAVLNGLWKRVAAAGGVEAIADREIDDVDESNFGDYQLSMAARAAAYAARYDQRKQEQLASLAAWVESAK